MIISFLTFFFFPIFFPKLRLLFFAPYLISSLYKKSIWTTLWRGLFVGVIIDLFSSSSSFGLTSLVYVLSCFLLSSQKRNFFEDKLITLPLMTAFFSILSTFLNALFLVIFEQQMLFSTRFILTELFGMALADALFALLFFSLPVRIGSRLSITKKMVRLMR